MHPAHLPPRKPPSRSRKPLIANSGHFPTHEIGNGQTGGRQAGQREVTLSSCVPRAVPVWWGHRGSVTGSSPCRVFLLGAASGGSVRLAPGRPERRGGLRREPGGPLRCRTLGPRVTPMPGPSGRPGPRSQSWAAPQPLSLAAWPLSMGAALGGPMRPVPQGSVLRPARSLSQTRPRSLLAPPRPASVSRSPFQSVLALCSPPAASARSAPAVGHTPSCVLGPASAPSACASLRLTRCLWGRRRPPSWGGEQLGLAGPGAGPTWAGRDMQPPGLRAAHGQPRDGLFLECGASQAWHEAWAAANSLQDGSQAWGGVTPFSA